MPEQDEDEERGKEKKGAPAAFVCVCVCWVLGGRVTSECVSPDKLFCFCSSLS